MINPKIFEDSLKKVLGKTSSNLFTQGLFESVDWFPYQIGEAIEFKESEEENLNSLKKDIKSFIDKTSLVKNKTESSNSPNVNELCFELKNRLNYQDHLKELMSIGINSKKIYLKSISKDTKVKVLFISDEFKISDHTESALEAITLNKSNELFAKMIQAMKLKEEDYLVTGFSIIGENGKVDCFDLVLNEIILTNPDLIISLGVISTQILLKTDKHFTDLRSKFYNLKIVHEEESFESSILPLFHPDLLKINNNLKNLAWKDMQMAMEYLNLK